MEKITYRSFRRCDYPTLIKMVHRLWAMERLSNHQIFTYHLAAYQVNQLLLAQDYSIVATVDQKVVGFLFARIGRKSSRVSMLHKWRRYYHLKRLRHYAFDEAKALSAYQTIENTFSEMMVKHHKQYPSELLLFVVDDQYQGRGIGKTLLRKFYDMCDLHHVKEICLVTDSDCNYGFYDYLGFQLQQKRKIEIIRNRGTEMHQTFLYSQSLEELDDIESAL